VKQFIDEAARAGVDGLLVLDLPPEESENYEQLMAAAGLRNIYLVAPTTPEERIAQIVKRATGFIYYVSREGVTGMQVRVSDTIAAMTASIRAQGSAIVNQIEKLGRSPELVPTVAGFVKTLAQGVRAA
jgi:tryptophan synthase alpha chain